MVRVGLIGCGKISGRHVNWFLDHPDCAIAALCDVDADAARNCAAAVSSARPDGEVAVFGDYADVVSRDDIDAVAVLLPHHLHHPVAMAALQRGKHVLVEKPMVTSSVEGRDLVKAAEAAGTVLSVGYQRSYVSEYVYVRNMIRRGELGKVRFMSAHLEQGWYQHILGAGEGGSWRSDPKATGGGQLMDTGSHTLAALLWVSGLEPVEVFAYMDKCGLDVDVNTVLTVRFREDALASISIGGFGDSVTEVLRIVGDKASARIFFRTVREQSLEIDGQPVDAKSVVEPSTPNANFIDAILGRAQVETGGQLGLDVVRISEAAYRSAEEHWPMQLV
jgi:predicted dehydrogenase